MFVKLRFLLAFFLACTIWSCGNKALYDETMMVPEDGWDYNQVMEFSFPVTDTSQVCDIQLHLRNYKSYAYSNIWLFVKTTAPNGISQKDTVEIVLTDETGKWIGKETRSINTVLVPYIRNVKFPQLGVYTVNIQHAMRDTLLFDISDVGVRVATNQ